MHTMLCLTKQYTYMSNNFYLWLHLVFGHCILFYCVAYSCVLTGCFCVQNTFCSESILFTGDSCICTVGVQPDVKMIVVEVVEWQKMGSSFRLPEVGADVEVADVEAADVQVADVELTYVEVADVDVADVQEMADVDVDDVEMADVDVDDVEAVV